jgi:hypothetical protein
MTVKNKNFFRLFVGISLWLTVSCSAVEKQLEPLFGIVLTKGNIRIQVQSNGCTNDKSFSIELNNNELTIYRVKPDLCRRGSFRVWIDFSKHYRITQLTLKNPIKFFDKSF